jgi:hypothetical protein
MNKRLANLVIGLALVLGTTGAMRSSGAARATFLTPPTAVAVDCTTDATLCLQDGRFLVEATWKKSDGTSGAGHPVNLGSDSGYFWFLDPDNVELVVKALDGCAVNGHGWFFSGGLTNLEVAITVTDTLTGEIRNYANPQGVAFLPIADAAAFGCPAGAAALFARNPEEPREDDPAIVSGPAVAERRAAAVGCTEGDTVLCIDGRFRVEASWQAASGLTGAAHAVPMTSGSGYFWFFDQDNVELVVKALDACGIGKGQWFFAAGLTTVGVQLRVTDTFTGEMRNYASPLGSSFLPIQDTAAFAFCPTPTPTPTPTPSPTPTVTPSERPTRSRTPRHTPTPTPGPRVLTVPLGCTVTLVRCGPPFPRHFSTSCEFSPRPIHIRVGDTINWVWTSGVHSTTSAAPSTSSDWDSGVQTGPFTFSKTFTQVGSFPYFCSAGHLLWHSQSCGNRDCCVSHLAHETSVIVVDP